MIQEVESYISKLAGAEGRYVVAGDTDSIYVRFDSLMPALMKSWDDLPDEGKIQAVDKVAGKIQKYINDDIVQRFARDTLGTSAHYFEIKREKIIKAAFFMRKKRYVMWLVDDEGKRTSERKAVGIEIVRSNMTREVKEKLKEIIWMILKGEKKKEINQKVKEMKESLREMPSEAIALPISIQKSLDEYKTVPIQVRGARWYNRWIEETGAPVRPITAGDRIMYLPLIEEFSKNVVGERIDVISFPEKCPIEEGKIKKIINWGKLEERYITSPLSVVYEHFGWNFPGEKKRTTLSEFSLDVGNFGTEKRS